MEEKEKFNQSKYNYQWAQENYYRLTVLLPKNQKDKIKAPAHAMEQIRRRDASQRTRDQTRAEAQPNAERNRKQQNTQKSKTATNAGVPHPEPHKPAAHAHKLRAVFLPRAHCLRFRRRSFCAIIIYIAVVYYISLNILYAII